MTAAPGPARAIRHCLSRYLHFGGRTGRSDYWWFYGVALAAALVAHLIDGLVFGFEAEAEPGKHPLTLVVSFVALFPTLSAGWRRMQDTGRPGWYVVLPMLLVLATTASLLVGVFGFGLIEALGADPETLRDVAAPVGVAVLVIAYAAILAAALLKLWWLTRPGDDGTNAYGPPPAG